MISFFIPIHLSQTSNICSGFRQYPTSRQVSIMFFRTKTKKNHLPPEPSLASIYKAKSLPEASCSPMDRRGDHNHLSSKSPHVGADRDEGHGRDPKGGRGLPSRRDFYQEFHRVCDLSFLAKVASYSPLELDARFECVGEGTHFRTWKIPLRSVSLPSRQHRVQLQRSGEVLEQTGALVVKKPLKAFLDRKTPSRTDWERILRILDRASTCTLISPFLRIPLHASGLERQRHAGGALGSMISANQQQDSGGFALVMPFGTLVPSAMGRDKAPLSHSPCLTPQMIEGTQSWLWAQGVQLRDIPQIRWCGPLPVMIDISDAVLIG